MKKRKKRKSVNLVHQHWRSIEIVATSTLPFGEAERQAGELRQGQGTGLRSMQ